MRVSFSQRLRRRARALALATASVIVLGCSRSNEVTPEDINARSLTLRDEAGRKRLVLRLATDGSPEVVLSDVNGVERARLALNSSADPALVLSDSEGEPSFRIEIHGSDGAQLSMSDARTTRVRLGATPSAAQHFSLVVTSPDGTASFQAGSSENSSSYAMVIGRNGAWEGLALDEAGLPTLVCYDSRRRERLRIGVDERGSSQVALLDGAGSPAALLLAPEREFGVLNLSGSSKAPAIYLGMNSSQEIVSGILDASGSFRAALLLAPSGESSVFARDDSARAQLIADPGHSCGLELMRKGNGSASATVGNSGEPEFRTTDKDGSETWRSK